MLHTMEALLWILVGAALGGVIQVIQGRYSEFKKGQALGLAVAAELGALRELVTFRDYSGYADAMIQRLSQEGYVPTILDVIAISVEEDYFTIFHALSSEIAILGELAGEVTSVYAHAKGLIEDLRQLEHRKRELLNPSVFFGMSIPDEELPVAREFMRQIVLHYTTHIKELLQKCLDTTIEQKLRAHAQELWIQSLLNSMKPRR